MEKIKKLPVDIILSYVVSFGLVLFPVDNYQLGGWLRLKEISVALVVIGSLGIIARIDRIRSNKWINIGIGVILFTIWLDALFRQVGLYKVYDFALVGCFVLIYVASLSNKHNIRRLFPYAVLIEAVGCIIQGIFKIQLPRESALPFGYFVGGIITSAGYSNVGVPYVANYNLAAGYMAFGLIFSNIKWQRILIPIVILAVFFTGSIEGIYIVGGIILWMLVTKNLVWWDWIAFSVVGVLIGLWSAFGTGFYIWYRLLPFNQDSLITNIGSSEELGWKLKGLKTFFNTFSWFGSGYQQTVTADATKTVHNVPLVIIQQIGVIPAIMWSAITTWCLIKRKIKESCLWIGILLMCIFDHMIWTSFAMYWWLAVGISSKVKIND